MGFEHDDEIVFDDKQNYTSEGPAHGRRTKNEIFEGMKSIGVQRMQRRETWQNQLFCGRLCDIRAGSVEY